MFENTIFFVSGNHELIPFNKRKLCANFKNNNQTSNLRKTIFKTAVIYITFIDLSKIKQKKFAMRYETTYSLN